MRGFPAHIHIYIEISALWLREVQLCRFSSKKVFLAARRSSVTHNGRAAFAVRCFSAVNQPLCADESRAVLQRELAHTMYHVWFDCARLKQRHTYPSLSCAARPLLTLACLRGEFNLTDTQTNPVTPLQPPTHTHSRAIEKLHSLTHRLMLLSKRKLYSVSHAADQTAESAEFHCDPPRCQDGRSTWDAASVFAL